MSTKGIRHKKRVSKQQKVWNYMRRNRSFCIADIMAIFDLSKSYCTQMLYPLCRAGYVALVDDRGRYQDRIYKLLKDTGRLSPTYKDGVLYDINIDLEYKVERKKSAELENSTKIISALKQGRMTHATLLRTTKLARSSFALALKRLQEDGVVIKEVSGVYRLA